MGLRRQKAGGRKITARLAGRATSDTSTSSSLRLISSSLPIPGSDPDQVIASIDYAKQDDVRERVWQQRWDLIIIDEAHKCSAYTKKSPWRCEEAEKAKRHQP